MKLQKIITTMLSTLKFYKFTRLTGRHTPPKLRGGQIYKNLMYLTTEKALY